MIAPDVKTTLENTANDMGSYEFKFLDPETSEEVLISKDGDWTMKTDDPALIKAQDKAAKILTKQLDTIKARSLSLNTAIVNVPYGGKDLIGKNMSFDSYDKFKEFCQKNGRRSRRYLRTHGCRQNRACNEYFRKILRYRYFRYAAPQRKTCYS